MAESESLDKKFQDKVNSLTSHGEDTAKGLVNEGQVTWDTLDDGGPDKPGPARFLRTFHKEFKRTDLGKKYIQANSEVSSGQDDIKSRVSQLMLYRTQYDWLMQMERDYLMRRRTRIRTEAHAASVREMMGDGEGPIQIGIMREAKQVMALAAKTEKVNRLEEGEL